MIPPLSLACTFAALMHDIEGRCVPAAPVLNICVKEVSLFPSVASMRVVLQASRGPPSIACSSLCLRPVYGGEIHQREPASNKSAICTLVFAWARHSIQTLHRTFPLAGEPLLRRLYTVGSTPGIPLPGLQGQRKPSYLCAGFPIGTGAKGTRERSEVDLFIARPFTALCGQSALVVFGSSERPRDSSWRSSSRRVAILNLDLGNSEGTSCCV